MIKANWALNCDLKEKYLAVARNRQAKAIRDSF
jgi:hypothetical protein